MLYNIFSLQLYLKEIYLFCAMKAIGVSMRMVLSLLALVLTLPVLGVGFAPVRNFTRQEYGAGSQNWAASQDPLGRMFFGNRDGLLQYDGIRWRLYHLPNYTTVRTVFADDKTGRVYVGGSNEFGYFLTDPETLRHSYVSWVPILPDEERDFAEIWNIHEIEEGRIVFQADYSLFITNGESATVINSKDKITTSALIGSKLYLATQGGTIMLLNGNNLTEVARTPSHSRIVGLLPYHQQGILVVTSTEGLYTLGAEGLRPENWEISDFLKHNQTFSATHSGKIYAFGTVNNGAVTVNSESGETIYINRDTGLQNNTVLGLGFDFSSNLWLCLDNGLSYAMVDSPVFNLLGHSSDAGAGYSSLLYGNNLYLATNRGLFAASYPFEGKVAPPRLRRIHSGQVWGLDSIGRDIFVSADDGLYLLSGPQTPLRIPGIEGGSWFVAPLKTQPGKALASTYNGFYLLSHSGGTWKSEGRISGYDDAGGKFVEDKDGNLWIAHWIKGIYRLRLAPDLKSFSQVKLYTSSDGLPSERDNSLAIYNGKLRIATASGEFFLVNPDGSLSRDENLTRLIPLRYPAHFYALPSGMSFAFSPKLVWKMTRDTQGKMKVDSVSLRMVANSLIPGFEHVGFLDENNMLVSHQEGFYSISLADKAAGNWKNGVFVESLVAGDSTVFSALPKGMNPDLKIPYALNSLTFNFAAPEYRFENGVLFSCKLEDYDKEWSTPSEAASKEYTQLHEGSYTLRVRALNTVTGEVAETALKFTVLPPWYRSVWAKIVYVLVVVFLILLGYRLFRYLSLRNARKVERQKEVEMENVRREAEKEAIKKDYEIAALKSSQLELDIKHKSSELSNTTMNVIRKNEILLDISSMLNRLREREQAEGSVSPKLKKELDKIQNLIQENISHDDDWKKFNQNFDIVYADFTRHLSERHPDLTVAEKRLCCYLKMGLSSKEIAPIFNISPKSVEMNRYRLRRKMGLEREDNLVEYLQNI